MYQIQYKCLCTAFTKNTPNKTKRCVSLHVQHKAFYICLDVLQPIMLVCNSPTFIYSSELTAPISQRL